MRETQRDDTLLLQDIVKLRLDSMKEQNALLR